MSQAYEKKYQTKATSLATQSICTALNPNLAQMERVDFPQFQELARANPNLLIYPAFATLERILQGAFHDPDDHLDAWSRVFGVWD